MKKKLLLAISALVLTIAVVFSFAACNKTTEHPTTYNSDLENAKLADGTQLFANKTEQVGQTVIHDIIMDFYESPLPEGKKYKKIMFMGYDGYRADAIPNIADSEKSAIMTLRQENGLYFTYSGGKKGDTQPTSTAPSWASMLTGGWDDYHGVANNGYVKDVKAETFLTKLARKGMHASFTTSWAEHQTGTYSKDIAQSIVEGIPVEYLHYTDDAFVYYQILKYVANPKNAPKSEKVINSEEDPSVIFFTLEYTDHAGHDTGFGNGNEDYVKASRSADEHGYEILQTIYNRATYDEEDWLIIISTDHGGTVRSHGGRSPMERTTWLTCNKDVSKFFAE